MDEKITEGWSNWIDVGKLSDLKKLFSYANTDNSVWHIGVINKGGEYYEEDILQR